MITSPSSIHDDIVGAHILGEYVRAINEDPSIDLLYCDEDTISEDGAIRSAPMFKPEFNIDLLTSLNYVLHMLTVSRQRLQKRLSPMTAKWTVLRITI